MRRIYIVITPRSQRVKEGVKKDRELNLESSQQDLAPAAQAVGRTLLTVNLIKSFFPHKLRPPPLLIHRHTQQEVQLFFFFSYKGVYQLFLQRWMIRSIQETLELSRGKGYKRRPLATRIGVV